ncbi:MAG: SsrA-binding protein SmpB [Candidatus Margulisbacteria bacterium]|nr:SsrA-binding protein SmpB [Candidatus Margulisiibacteriota bacterium]
MASNTYYKVAAENRKARFDFNIIEVYKAGLVLTGNEVKSIRRGQVNLQDSFGRVEREEVWIYNMHISPYSSADQSKIDPIRRRKVLLQKRELVKLIGKVAEKGLTLIPLKVYFDGNWAKLDLALAKSKKKYEKRDTLRRKIAEREIERAFKGKINDRKNRN